MVPLLKIIEKMLQEEAAKATVPVARKLREHLIWLLGEKLDKRSRSVLGETGVNISKPIQACCGLLVHPCLISTM